MNKQEEFYEHCSRTFTEVSERPAAQTVWHALTGLKIGLPAYHGTKPGLPGAH